jgi:hypothetical protein
MKKHLLFISLLAITFFGYSQETIIEEITFESTVPTTDRGTFTKSGSNINKGLQFELGFNYDWVDSRNNTFKTDVMSPIEGNLRLGLSKYVELDFAISNRQLVQRPWDENGSFQEDRYGFWSPLEIGIRTQFVDSKKKSGTDASLYLGLAVNNTQRSVFNDNGTSRPYVLVDRPSYVAPEMAFLVNHNIGKRIVLGYNAGLKWTGIVLDDAASAKNPDIFYSVRALIHVAAPFDIYVEHFNAIRSSFSPNLGMNFGARYAVTEKFVLDVNGGLGLNDNSSDGFAGVGLTYKLGK